MESNGLLSNLGSSGMLGLEMSLHPQNPHHLHHQHSQMMQFDHNNPQNNQSTKQNYPFTPTNHKQTQQHVLVSDDDEPMGGDDDDGDGTKRKGASQWQRMKWTDGMVKLLIRAVYYIGDDQAGNEMVSIDVGTGKKKSGAGLLQKKGKWKSVSRAMMEKGFLVSPQQCEDKFNDLNKRYKRVNDVLGKGIACKVVENQSLLDSMDHLSSKMKDEVRKLLNSKHLFFREMCAYHNSFGLGCSQALEETAAGPSNNHHQHDQQRSYHSPDNHVKTPNSGKTDTEGSKMGREKNRYEDNDEEEEEDYDDGDDEDYEDCNHCDEGLSRKRTREGIKMLRSPLVQQFSNELMNVINDGLKKPWEKKQWVKTQLMKLEEQRVCYQFEAFELEKQRLKWVKFSSKKEREMERAKLKNEQTKLENERMMLLLRQKELELIGLQHHHQQQHSLNKRGDPSSITG